MEDWNEELKSEKDFNGNLHPSHPILDYPPASIIPAFHNSSSQNPC